MKIVNSGQKYKTPNHISILDFQFKIIPVALNIRWEIDMKLNQIKSSQTLRLM